ncbi:MAG: ATP-binding protein [Candidatus Methanoplasma sp.]|jgi:predicted AAA+ superfamily ATPase|nr:ATP-binding protein [Candidatus Methanoplasma sp.]
MNALKPFRGNGNAKVITGIRRCGKSSLLGTFADSLPAGTNVIRINMEFSENIELRTWQKLLEHITARLDDYRENLLIIDEVQDVPGWEIAVRDLIAKSSCDIYITGSNSNLLSSEYSTYLGGRYDSVHVMPLSFSECVEFHEKYHGTANRDDILQRFIRVGGFPILWRYNQDETSSLRTVRTLVDSSVNNDITARYGVRNVDLLMRILKTLASTVGSYVSAVNIYNTLKSNGTSVSKDAVYEYLGYLEAANIIIKAETTDVRGREILRTGHKYYFTDLAIKHSLIGYRPEDTPGHMENIIFTELKGRGYDVHVGRAEGKEVDIVADKGNERIYVQACMTFGSEETIKREFSSLESIDDNHPKFIVLMDVGPYRGISAKGIICCGLREFLEMRTYGGLL